MRETAFELEKLIFSENRSKESTNAHVFIVGLARSGTTALLNGLYDSKQFSSITYADMPFVLSPNLWGSISGSHEHAPAMERLHGDGINVTSDSPEAFEEVFWMTFDGSSNSQSTYFKEYVSLINKKYDRSRYLSKNNQNIKRIELLSHIFPNAKILVVFRHPIEHCLSLYRQHKNFITIQNRDPFVLKYMNWIGHTEFGMTYKPLYFSGIKNADPNDFNHWLEQWIFTYNRLLADFAGHKNVVFVSYEKLCKKSETWHAVKRESQIESQYQPRSVFLNSNRAGDYPCNLNLKTAANSIYSSLTAASL